MRERPILFSGPMVRAILDGTKTQTRRVVKITHRTPGLAACLEPADPSWVRRHTAAELCPYGQPGDRLWVRETCRAHELTDEEALNDTFGLMEKLDIEVPPYGLDGVIYTADDTFRKIENTREASDAWMEMNAYRGKRGAIVPAIHMPRWASRITLEITDVRVERLQEISEADAMAEGAEPYRLPVHPARESLRHVDGYARLWDKINVAGSWNANPWVWAISFRRVGDA